MVKALTKVIYKPDSQSTEEFSMIVDADEVSPGGSFSLLVAVLMRW
jgi:hypothetical protein